MGKLAVWGGVAGAAKGWNQLSVARGEAEAKATQSTIDHDRNMALERFRASNAQALEETRQAGATGRTEIGADATVEAAGIGAESRETVAGMNIEGRADQQDDQQAHLESEGVLNRESRERIAAIQASASSASIRAALERFEPRTLKVGQDTGIPGYVVEQDTPAVYDKQEGRWYVQEGDKYVLPGTPPESIRRPGQGAVDKLWSQPELANSFLNDYGYLPMGFLSLLRAPQGTSGQGGMLSTGREGEQTTPAAGQE